MVKKTKNFLVLALLAAAAIGWTQAHAGQEILGEQEIASASTEQSPGHGQDQYELDFQDRQDKAWQEFRNKTKNAVKSGYVNLLIACGLIEPLSHVITVAHELGHAHMGSIFFPGSIHSIKFLPYVLKVAERSFKTAMTYKDCMRYKRFGDHAVGKYIIAGGSVSRDSTKYLKNVPDASLMFKVQDSLVDLAGPVAGVVAAVSLGKLSKHKKCPEWMKWPLRAVSCVLAIEQLGANLVPNKDLSNDGGQLFKLWTGKDGNSRERRLVASLVGTAVWYGATAYFVHREFPNFFKKIKEALIDFHESMQY